MIPRAIEKSLESIEPVGSIVDSAEMTLLSDDIGGIIPDWYIELLAKYPLTGLELGWLAYPEECGDDQLSWVEFSDINTLRELNTVSFPGVLLNPLGYFVFAYGATYAGNCLAFNVADGDNPPIYEIWHDVASNKDEMLKSIAQLKGVTKISVCLSDFFKNAVVESET